MAHSEIGQRPPSGATEPPTFSVFHPHFAKQKFEESDSPVVRAYVSAQNEMIDDFLFVERLRSSTGSSTAANSADNVGVGIAAARAAERWAINVSFGANLLLFAAKVMAALMTGSMVVLVSTLDSALDLLSGGILFATALLAERSDPAKYPLGKARMEPLGIVGFSTLMGMSAVMVLVESVKQIVDGASDDEGQSSETREKAIATAAILGGVVVAKGMLYIWCRRVQQLRGSTTVEAYADDHRNDTLGNALSAGAFCLSQFQCSQTRDSEGVCPTVDLWWVDPSTAVCLALFIVWSWTDSAREQLLLLVGHAAPTQLTCQLTYAAASHEPDAVKQVDKVLCWSAGENHHCEVDICLPENMPLKQAHDIGERLEVLLECLPTIERYDMSSSG